MTVMTDTESYDGMILTLMKAKASTFRGYPQTFHVGFFIDDRTEINRLHQLLKNDGYDVGDAADIGHSYGFYVEAPGGFTVEVSA